MWLAWRLDHCKRKHSCPAWSLLSAAKHFYLDGSSLFQDDSLSLQKDTRGHWLVWRAWKWCKSYLIRIIVAQNRPLGSDYISREQWSAYTRLIFIEICSCLLYLSKWNPIQPKRLKKMLLLCCWFSFQLWLKSSLGVLRNGVWSLQMCLRNVSNQYKGLSNLFWGHIVTRCLTRTCWCLFVFFLFNLWFVFFHKWTQPPLTEGIISRPLSFYSSNGMYCGAKQASGDFTNDSY